MRNKLYKLAILYIGKCNAKWNITTTEIKKLDRLTYRNNDKAYLLYGADSEWKKFSRYDVLDNSIQKLADFEDIGTVEEFKTLKEKNEPKKPLYISMVKDKDTNVGRIGRCPCCNYIVSEDEDLLWCEYCGQKLDWS